MGKQPLCMFAEISSLEMYIDILHVQTISHPNLVSIVVRLTKLRKKQVE